jgi:hypothetical protein
MDIRSILLLLIPLTTVGSPAQERVIPVSPRVGLEIDSSECAKYQILQQFRGLRKAVVLQAPDSTYRMVVTMCDSRGREWDSSLAVTGAFLHTLFSKIEYRDALQTGSTVGGFASSPFLSQQPAPGDVPFGTGPSLFNEYPRLGFSVGIFTMKPELSGLDNTVRSILDAYRDQGYAMQRSATSPALGMPLTAPVFGLSGTFSPEWRAEIHACVPSGADIDLSYVSLAAAYTPGFLSAGAFRLGFTASLLRLTHEFTRNFRFEGSGNRISLIDAQGRYMYLSSVHVTGNGVQWAGSVGLVGEIHNHGFAIISLFCHYTFPSTYASTLTLKHPPEVPLEVPLAQAELGQYELRMAGYSAGLQLTIQF